MAPDVGLRRFIEVLEKAGELRRISAEVDWQFEIGAILHEVNRRKGPAILFDHVKGYRQPLLAGALGSVGRIALALGLPKTTSSTELITEYKERVKHPIHPKIVATGPCKENIKYDGDVDLYSFPVPLWQQGS
jgi:4-hydroxy-3-polyprenylbenzoate decarboxylase